MRIPWLLCTALAALLALPAPAHASDVRVTAERPGAVEVAWTEVSGATGYVVWRREGLRGRWERLASLPAGTASYADRAVSERRFYTYRVTPEGAGAPREAGPVEALARSYVELREAVDGAAVVRIHQWDQAFDEWRQSDPVRVAVGRPLMAAGVVTNFATGATLLAAGPDPAQVGVGRALYRTRQGAVVEVTTRDLLPLALRVKKKVTDRASDPKPARARTGSDAPPIPARGGPAPVSLEFPEPQRIGTAPGDRVVWEIENASKLRLLLVITGRAGRTFTIGPEKTFEVKLPGGGDYEVVANAQDNKIIPLKGEFGLQSGVRYKSVLGIRPAGN